MRNLRGKTSNLTIISKFFNSLSNLCHPYKPNVSDFPFSKRLRLFSTTGGNPVRGQFESSSFDEFNEHNSDDNDTFSGKNRRNFTAQQNPNFRRQNPTLDRSFGRKGREFNGQFDGGRNRANMRSNDDFFNFNGNDEGRGNVGLGGHVEGKTNSRPSISELSNRPLKGDEDGGKEGGDLLEKFKLDDEDKKEDQSDESKHAIKSQEEKMEPTEDAEVIFKKMKQSGLIPNAVAMLDGLCRDGLVQEAMKLFEVMREKRTMPEVVVYTAVVEGFCQAQKLDDAKRVFRKMQGNGIAPNAFSYAVLIKGLCRGKRLEDAVDICVEMLEAGHLPSVTTFTAFHEFCEEKSVEEAQNMIDTLKQKGFYLDEKAVRNHLDKTGPTSPFVSQAIFGPTRPDKERYEFPS